MNLCGKYISIFIYLLKQNEKSIAECVGGTYPGGFNYKTNDLISRKDPRSLEIITQGSTSNDTSKYDFKQFGLSGNIYEYKFKADAECVEVQHQNNKVWSRGDEATPVLGSEKEYPLKIVYHVQAKAIFIVFSERYLGYVYLDHEWILRVNKENVKVRRDPRSTLVSNVDISGWPMIWDIWDYEEQSEPEETPDFNETSLENKSDKSQDKVKQEKQEHDKSSSSSSTPDPNETKKTAKQDQQEPDKQQSKVSEPTDTSGKPGQSSISTSTPDSTKSKKERKGIKLDIGSKKNTEEYNYKVNYLGTGIYSAESDYAFNHVKDGSSKIWSTDKQDEFADFVDVSKLGDCGTEVTIFMLNKTAITFKKCCCSWKQDKLRENTSSCPSFSWKCFVTLGLYNCCCKDKCC